MESAPDRTCLVTGTSSGIGLAVAGELLRRGWDVAGVARRPARLHHARYRHHRLDLADTARLEAALEGTFGESPALDGRARVGLVNGAGEVVGEEARAHAAGSSLPVGLSLVSYAPGVVDTEMQEAVRGTAAEAFPQVARFLDLHATGRLHHPSEPAAEIADLLESAGLPPFSERRLGG